ncbi:MAG: hypothetical protein U9P44_01850, partial [archaeon]|nr:hypothetical protein [archaeon]
MAEKKVKNKQETGKTKQTAQKSAEKSAKQAQKTKLNTLISNPWAIATGILAILLIASIFTCEFDLKGDDDNYNKTIDSIDNLISAAVTVEAISSLENAKTEIENALEIEMKESEDTKDTVTTGTEKSVTLDMYVMSQCPYGAQAEDGAIPAVKELSDSVDYNIHFIVTDNGDGTFSSLHGQPEVDENTRQLCIMEHNQNEFFDYLMCLNKDYRNAETVWKSCAEENNINTETIASCQTGDEGKELLSKSAEQSRSVGATGSPTIYMNGEPYQQGRDTLSFTRAICQIATDNPKCASIPECTSDADCIKQGFIGKCTNPDTEDAKCEYTEPPAVNIIILNDKTCAGCDTTEFDKINEQIFINTDITVIDISTDKGKALLEQIKPDQIPVYLFDSAVTQSPQYERLKQYFTEEGEYYMLSPSIVGQYIESPKMIGREVIEGKLDLFAMSKCPYGVQAENNMKEVLDTFGDNINFEIHFIATDNGDGTFSSLHGQPEVDENLRQICIIEHNNEEFYNYLMCQNANFDEGKDLDTTWEECAFANSIDTETIDTCFKGDEGAELLRANIALTEELGIGSSPTFLINNMVKFGGALPA